MRRFLPILAILTLAAGCIPARAATLIVIHNLSGGTLAVSQPWQPEVFHPLAGAGGFRHELLAHGQRASFSLPGSGTTAELVCVIHRLDGEGRLQIEGLEVRALASGFIPVGPEPLPLPWDEPPSGRMAPAPGTASPPAP